MAEFTRGPGPAPAHHAPRGFAAEGPARMPLVWDEFAAAELAPALAGSRCEADGMLGLARDLEVMLPGTRAASRDGILTEAKAEIIAAAVAHAGSRRGSRG